ncbi:hypothetical protein BH11MYX4_BH11MYX4_69360 [soil metagenome]
MPSVLARVLVGLASVAALVLAYALPGSYVLAAGMLVFNALPLLLRLPIGVPLPAGEGTLLVTGRNAAQRMDATVRILGVLSWLAFAWAASLRPGEVMLSLFAALGGTGTAVLALLGLVGLVFKPDGDAHGVALDRETLTVNGPGGAHVLRYADLRNVELDGRRIWLATAGERLVVDVLGNAKRAAEIRQAILDAKAKQEREARRDTRGAKELHRPSGMSAREWLGRIDALVAAGRERNAYRGAAIDEEALWTLLRDDGANGEARAAAARVLASSPDEEMRVRVASTAAEISSEPVRLRVALAMNPDAERAASEMEALDMEELRRTAGV